MITLEEVSFSYGEEGKNALESHTSEPEIQDLNLTIRPGSVVLLVGRSGCGKTTITRLVNGLIPHYYQGSLQGEVLCSGKRVAEAELFELAPQIGSVFQNPRSQFFATDTTSELSFACENLGIPPEEISQRVDETFRAYGIEHLRGRSIFELSGGEKQKLACAAISTIDPEIMVLDEPSSNLDAAAIQEIRKVIEFWKTQGKTIIVAEHRIHYLVDLVDDVLFFDKGQLCERFSGEEFCRKAPMEIEALGLRPTSLDACFSSEKKESDVDDPRAQTHDSSAREGEKESLVFRDFHLCRGPKRTETCVLNIEELEIPRASITALVGRNGAGKTSFVRSIAGLERKARGVLYRDGEALTQKQRIDRCFLVMQDVNHQLFTESVLEEVLLGMPEEDESEARLILENLDVVDQILNHPLALSGGQKQRVAIASAVASKRDVIIYDEPTSGLDLRHMQEVADLLRSLRRQGKDQIVVTHDPEFIVNCCDYIVHLEQGAVREAYSLDEEGTKKLKQFFTEEMRS